MALINTIIPPAGYEVVRDRIAEILATELARQQQLDNTLGLPTKAVWLERVIPFDKAELPVVNVMLEKGDFDGHTMVQADGNYTYNIDVYASGRADNTNQGDKRALLLLHRLLRICRAVLENPKYKTLGFNPGFVEHRRTTGIAIASPVREDSYTTVMGRLTLFVKVPENTELPTPANIAGWLTQVQLYDTNNGYVFSGTPPTPDEPTVFLYADRTALTETGTVHIAWFSTGATTVSISGIGEVASTGQMEVEVSPGDTLTITAENGAGTATDSITFTTNTGGMNIAEATTDGTGTLTVPALVGKTLKCIGTDGGGFLNQSEYEFNSLTGTITWTADTPDLVSDLIIYCFYI